MTAILKTIFEYGPLVFAFGFIAPLTAQILERSALMPPSVDPLWVGLALAALWGGYAQIKGSWL